MVRTVRAVPRNATRVRPRACRVESHGQGDPRVIRPDGYRPVEDAVAWCAYCRMGESACKGIYNIAGMNLTFVRDELIAGDARQTCSLRDGQI